MKISPLIYLALFISPLSVTFPQGALTPPGTPAPTMKTLQQIEPRIDLKTIYDANHDGVGDDISTEIPITAPGSYFLSENLAVTRTNGITVAQFAAGVTIDLNGFEIRRTSGTGGTGLLVTATINSVQVRNGTVNGFQTGVGFVSGASSTRSGSFTDMAVSNCTIGFSGSRDWVFTRCRAFANNTGFDLTTRVTAVDCTAAGNFIGFRPNGGCVLRGCVAAANTNSGFRFSGGNSFTDCAATSNTEMGFFSDVPTDSGGTFANCSAIGNAGGGFSLTQASTMNNCTAKGSGGTAGILVGPGSSVNHCTATNNASTYGIYAGHGSTVTHCTASQNQSDFGIYLELRSTLNGSTASENTSASAESFGIKTEAQCTIVHCSASGNANTNATPTASSGGGIYAKASSAVKDCSASANKGDGILIESDSRVSDSNCDSNGNVGDGAGIHALSSDNRIEGNNVTDNDRGIDIDSSGSLIIKNSASGNTLNYDIAAANSFGPLVVVTGVGDISGTAGSNHPWANFSY